MSDVAEDTDMELILLEDFDEEVTCDNCDSPAEYRLTHLKCKQGLLFCGPHLDAEMNTLTVALMIYDMECVFCHSALASISEFEEVPL